MADSRVIVLGLWLICCVESYLINAKKKRKREKEEVMVVPVFRCTLGSAEEKGKALTVLVMWAPTKILHKIRRSRVEC